MTLSRTGIFRKQRHANSVNKGIGVKVCVTREPVNRLYQMKDGSNNIAQYSYAGPTRVTGRSYLNGTSLSVSYDGGRQATNYNHSGSTGNFEYSFDKENNKKYEKRSFGSKGDAFKYDAIYRLTVVKYGVSNTDLNPSTPYENYTTYDSKEEFNLDGVGNRIEVTNDVTTTYTTNNLNQYTQINGTSFAYDNNGNLKDDGTNTYIYDYANRLLRVTRKSDNQVIEENQYDVLGCRVVKTNNQQLTTINYYYNGARCIEERDSNDITVAQYVFGNGIDEILTMDRNSHAYYYHENSLGSIYAVTTSTGNVVERYSYDAYGKPSFYDGSGNPISQSAINNSYLFTGREYDTESGLYYCRARHYSSDMGRFLQRDPQTGDNPVNLYTYVNNSPNNFVDPFGLTKVVVTRGNTTEKGKTDPVDKAADEIARGLAKNEGYTHIDETGDTSELIKDLRRTALEKGPIEQLEFYGHGEIGQFNLQKGGGFGYQALKAILDLTKTTPEQLLKDIFKKCAKIKVFSCNFFTIHAQKLYEFLKRLTDVSEIIGSAHLIDYCWEFRWWPFGYRYYIIPESDMWTLPEDLKKLVPEPSKSLEKPSQPSAPPKKQKPVNETKEKQKIKEEMERKTDGK